MEPLCKQRCALLHDDIKTTGVTMVLPSFLLSLIKILGYTDFQWDSQAPQVLEQRPPRRHEHHDVTTATKMALAAAACRAGPRLHAKR